MTVDWGAKDASTSAKDAGHFWISWASVYSLTWLERNKIKYDGLATIPQIHLPQGQSVLVGSFFDPNQPIEILHCMVANLPQYDVMEYGFRNELMSAEIEKIMSDRFGNKGSGEQ